MDGRVPGSIYTDLLAAGVLDQGPLLFRFNDVDYRWVSYNDWTYRLQFDGNSKKKTTESTTRKQFRNKVRTNFDNELI